jgi:hypothetical protein
VGLTNNLYWRLYQHNIGCGSEWTQLHRMVDLIKLYKTDSYFEEDRFTLEYMNIYGPENVRGGKYSNVTLSFSQMLEIYKSINHANNRCLACGSRSHFITQCGCHICYRCARPGHMAKNCEEKTHFLNGSLNGCYNCGQEYHWAYFCYNSHDIYGRKIPRKGVINKMYNFFSSNKCY